MDYTMFELADNISKKDDRLLETLAKYGERLEKENIISIHHTLDRGIVFRVTNFDNLIDSLCELEDKNIL